MACKGCLECLLKLLNFLLTLVGLTTVGYGIYLLVEWERAASRTGQHLAPEDEKLELVSLGRTMLMMVPLASSILDKLPEAWFIYLFIAIGVILFIIFCFGCIGTITRNGCCLSSFSASVILLILVELGCAAFIFFDHSWKEEIPKDKTGNFNMFYEFLKKHWKIARWVAIGAVIFEILVSILALVVRAANSPADYDSDDEFINPRAAARQPLINRQGMPTTGVPVPGALDNRPSRNDAWSTIMREEYGLGTSEFTYNPAEPNRLPQTAAPPTDD